MTKINFIHDPKKINYTLISNSFFKEEGIDMSVKGWLISYLVDSIDWDEIPIPHQKIIEEWYKINGGDL